VEITSNSNNMYNLHIRKLLTDMQASYDAGTIDNNVLNFQDRLDKLAATYQNNDSLGKLRYKLYEAQAYLHYFKGDNSLALKFIDEAVKIRGETFKGAVNLEDFISNKRHNSNVPPKHLPIDGWLAFLVFCLGVGVLYNIYQSFTGWGNFSLLTPAVNAVYPGLYSLTVAEQIAPILAVIFGIAVIILIFQRKKLARTLGIIFLICTVLWTGIDYSIATNMFANNTAAQNAINSGSASEFRLVIPAILWSCYLIFSKKVKRVLVIK